MPVDLNLYLLPSAETDKVKYAQASSVWMNEVPK